MTNSELYYQLRKSWMRRLLGWITGWSKHQVKFIAKQDTDGSRDGEAGWTVTVDSVEVCEIDNDEMDVDDNALRPLWEVLGLEVSFDYDTTNR